MFLKNYQILFFILLISGSITAVSANSWFTCWVGLEINLMSMIPLMLNKLSSESSEASIKYFIAQAMASILMIITASANTFTQELISLESTEILLAASLLMKAGMAPLHFWFPQVIINLEWIQALIIFTWQKVAPLILLISISMNILIMTSAITALVGAVSGFNQILMKLILTYSSISHGGWLIMSTFLTLKNFWFYFLIYCFLSTTIIFLFFKNKMLKFSEMFLSSESNSNKMLILMNMLSLGGLPPLLGFSAKLSIIIPLIMSNFYPIILILILSSLISLYFYTRLIYSTLVNKNLKNFKNKVLNEKTFSTLFSFSLGLNILTPVFMFM